VFVSRFVLCVMRGIQHSTHTPYAHIVLCVMSLTHILNVFVLELYVVYTFYHVFAHSFVYVNVLVSVYVLAW
jgi:hypothetical protein